MSVKGIKYLHLAGLLMLTFTLEVAAVEVSCGDAVNSLIPCGPFLIGAGQAQPGERCCQSAQELKRMATTTATRRSLCRCLEQAGPSFGVNPEQARKLLSLCKLDLNIPISATYNCNLLSFSLLIRHKCKNRYPKSTSKLGLKRENC
ncbi:non-specific lipid-transfer protein 1-like isoform X1 [Carex littledalei]|uniref:Non-specific lipid-transfer protein n=1 Tax=Carex littledalei TaxID=544730 RepID=A0A833V5P6_9POAL|nr:non-specific lipid-transfer protein 1-like isoform X1 [Carex littledalei]